MSQTAEAHGDCGKTVVHENNHSDPAAAMLITKAYLITQKPSHQ